MPANKNQHFVPRAYLKPFILDWEGKAINLYNTGLTMARMETPVKSQCSGGHFYGKDLEVENVLNVIETAYGALVSRVTASGYALSDRDARITLAFWFVQHVRTEAEAEADLKVSEEFEELVGAPDVFTKSTLADTAQHLMNSFQEHTEELFDLSVVLIRNKSDIPLFYHPPPSRYDQSADAEGCARVRAIARHPVRRADMHSANGVEDNGLAKTTACTRHRQKKADPTFEWEPTQGRSTRSKYSLLARIYISKIGRNESALLHR